MTNNDILRRLRYCFDITDSKMIALFGLAEMKISQAQLHNWLRKEDDPAYAGLLDYQLATFLDGLIIEKRGKKEGVVVKPEKRLNNNIILRKLKIALSLKDQDMLSILSLAGMQISKHELSAFFRDPMQSQFRPCKDQVLRNFLQGVQIKYRDGQ